MSTYERVQEHWEESKQYFKSTNMVGIFLQGSQNYNIDTEFSDVDTKMIVTPSVNEFIFSKPPMSATHVRANNEHIDFKDVRLMFQTFRKQNLNFLEILFTPYKIVNPLYEEEWNMLVDANEEIAHYNVFKAVSAMKGIAFRKHKSTTHMTSTSQVAFEKYGYDPKSLCHLFRIEEYLRKYTEGASYTECLSPDKPDFLKAVKMGYYNLGDAVLAADRKIKNVEKICELYTSDSDFNVNNTDVDYLLDEVQTKIIKKSLSMEVDV